MSATTLSVTGGRFPDPAIVRMPVNSPDGAVKIATFHHTATFDAGKMARQFVREHESHSALVEACEALLVAINLDEREPDKWRKQLFDAQEQARAALALAKGAKP